MIRRLENIAILLYSIFLAALIALSLASRHHLREVDQSINPIMTQEIVHRHNSNIILFSFSAAIITGLILFILFRVSKNKRSEIEKEMLTLLDSSKEELKGGRNINLKKGELESNFQKLITKINEMKEFKLSLNDFCNTFLSHLASHYEIFQGLFYSVIPDSDGKLLEIKGTYAFNKRDDITLKLGEGLAGQVAKAQRMVNIRQIPPGYIEAISGLGESSPSYLFILPVVHQGKTIAVLELAMFKELLNEEEAYLASLTSHIAEKLVELQNIA